VPMSTERLRTLYCALKYVVIPVEGTSFHRWIAFHQPITKNIRLIPDGYVELATPQETLAAFLEVDLGHERGPVWREKPKNYVQLALSGEFERRFGLTRFRVLVIANSLRRMHSLRRTVGAITQKIFWFATLEAIREQGCFAPVWYRPAGDQPVQFVEEPK
jgi:hypothetical protein